MRSDLPKFARNNRQEGTAEENKAVVQGSICYFGTYSVSEVDHTLNFHLESCSFPNWNGADVKRSFTLTGDELTWSGGGSSGRPIHTVWKPTQEAQGTNTNTSRPGNPRLRPERAEFTSSKRDIAV